MTNKQHKSLRSRLGAIAPWVVIILGLVLLVRPIALQWIEAWRASKGIDSVVSTYDEMSDPERAALREEARRYNEALFVGYGLDECLPYERQLIYRGSEMIAYISIPKCSVKLPVYHGTEEKALMAGVGHLKGTSLPAGGASSHCFLTAHTGMPGRRMFDDIGLLEAGDHFVIWVLGEALAYEVDESEVVLPDDTSSVEIVEGRDLCTLVTCTPYGVNSHRLLVHAHRCAYEEGEEEMPDIAVYVNGRTLPLLIALLFVLLLLVGLILRRLRKLREDAREDAGEGRES